MSHAITEPTATVCVPQNERCGARKAATCKGERDCLATRATDQVTRAEPVTGVAQTDCYWLSCVTRVLVCYSDGKAWWR